LRDQPYLHILQTGHLSSLRYHSHPLLPADPYDNYNHNHDNTQTNYHTNNNHTNNNHTNNNHTNNNHTNNNAGSRLDQRAAASTIWRITTRQRPTAPWTKLRPPPSFATLSNARIPSCFCCC
jgi:hypothetical protein